MDRGGWGTGNERCWGLGMGGKGKVLDFGAGGW